MVYDDIVIGSGLTALATVLGLPEGRRICVIAGSAQPSLKSYDELSKIPCANLGLGGLGSYWHGVIPLGKLDAFCHIDRKQFSDLFNFFYTDTLDTRLDKPWLFVPYRPIRPVNFWTKLIAERNHLNLQYLEAKTIKQEAGSWSVDVGHENLKAKRIWIAAGALGSAALLERSPAFAGIAHERISDHAILYLGQIDRRTHSHVAVPIVERGRSGIWMQGKYDNSEDGLLTTKPARFSYRQLDHGIEQRSAFGLPATGIVRKLCTAGSLGLISESLFNKLGLFPDSSILSVYAQVRVHEAYKFFPREMRLAADMESIQNQIYQFRDQLVWPELIKSRRPELFIRGIHLHRSLKLDQLHQSGFNSENSTLQIVDSSIANNIGPEHHSFKTMVYAYSLAKSSS